MSTFVPINDVCNLGCTFCGIGRRGATPDETVERALSHGVDQRVTFGGGEPTIDERLPQWLSHASEGGAASVVVETNGVRAADPAYAHHLVDRGLTGARLMLPAADEATFVRVTGEPSAYEAAWSGGANLLAAGADVSVVVPVSRANLHGLEELMGAISERLEGAREVTLRPVFFSMPEREGAHADDVRRTAEREMVPTARLTPALVAAVEAAHARGLSAHIDAPEGLPLCAFRDNLPTLEAVRPPRSRGSDRSRRADACRECAMLERCEGQGALDLALFGPAELRPYLRIPPALVRNTTFEPIVLRSPGLPAPGFGSGDKVEIRVVMPCNQDCTFCFVNREAPSPSRDALESAVDQALADGIAAVVFTGGEPTLSSQLPALLRRAADGGAACRGIQTNALLLAEGTLADELVDAGLNHAHVSLHAADATRYQAITGFGEPTDAARGARRLVERGVDVSISLVICSANADHIPETLRFIREEVGPVRVVLSVAREQLGVPRPWDETLIGFTEAGGAVVEALEAGAQLGLPIDSAGTCSMPPCVLPPESLAKHGDVLLVGHRTMTWEEDGEAERHDVANEFVAACERCALRERCPGIQRTYLERHGDGEFRAVERGPGAQATGQRHPASPPSGLRPHRKEGGRAPRRPAAPPRISTLRSAAPSKGGGGERLWNTERRRNPCGFWTALDRGVSPDSNRA